VIQKSLWVRVRHNNVFSTFSPILWTAFIAFVLLALAVDLGVFHRQARTISLREATAWSVIWVVVSIAFNFVLLRFLGQTAALEFFAGYVIEKSLSVDNLFVFVLLFRYFAVESRYQHRVLYWGVLGALIMRGVLIGMGVALISKFEWILYVFGAFLVYAGARMMFEETEEVHPERNLVFRWARKFLPMTKNYEGQRIFVHKEGVWRATPLFLVLLVVETTDLAFALDSIPAIFAITRDPFIVFSSNVCAILGLRAFYFLLAGVLPYFRYLGPGVSLVLIFVGGKMLAEHWIHIATPVVLAVIAGALSVAVIASLIAEWRERQAHCKLSDKEAVHAKKNSASEMRERGAAPRM
jgi:tellurite resistance protein TerC